MKKTLITLAILSSSIMLYANINKNDSIVKEIEETLLSQCEHQVKAFTHHLAFIAKKEIPDSIKDYHIEACHDLFIGKGKQITTISLSNKDNFIIPTPIVKVVNMTDSSTTCYSIKSYLKNLKHRPPMQNFESAEVYVFQFDDVDKLCLSYLKFNIIKTEDEYEVILVETELHSFPELINEIKNSPHFIIRLGDILITEGL